MTVSLGIKRHHDGRYDVIPIATSQYFAHHWLPACARLGLRLVPHLHDGAMSAPSSDELSEIVAELEILQAWAVTNDTFMAERIDRLLLALRESASEACEYDFG